jgi:hypothetical protein
MRFKYVSIYLMLGVAGMLSSHANPIFDSLKRLQEGILTLEGSNNKGLISLEVGGNELRKCMLAGRSPFKLVGYLGLWGIKSLWNSLWYENTLKKRFFDQHRVGFWKIRKAKSHQD